VRRTVPPSAEIEGQIDQLLAVGVGENPRESLVQVDTLENDELAHQAPAIVSRQSPSALAHGEA
jgi:hypothetical protein